MRWHSRLRDDQAINSLRQLNNLTLVIGDLKPILDQQIGVNFIGCGDCNLTRSHAIGFASCIMPVQFFSRNKNQAAL
jgi:hypothetical protein